MSKKRSSFQIDGVTYAVQDITPEFAQHFIGTDLNAHNRKVSKTHVDKLAYAINNDRWVMTGEAIKIGKDGRLFDGQHRLHAIIKANKSVPNLLIIGLDQDALHAMDGGKKRSVADQSLIASNVPTRVTALIQMCQMLAVGKKYYVDPWEVEEIHNAYPMLEEIADAYKDAPSNKMGSLVPAVEVALREAGYQEEADLFRAAWLDPYRVAPKGPMELLYKFRANIRDMAEKPFASRWTPAQRKDALSYYTLMSLENAGQVYFRRRDSFLLLPRVHKQAFIDRSVDLTNTVKVPTVDLVHTDQKSGLQSNLLHGKRRLEV